MADAGRGILGPSHPSPLLACSHLAEGDAAGRPQDATAALGHSPGERERAPGPDHPGTLSARNGLAHAHLAAGRQDEAILLQERTLADRERLLWPDHPDAVMSLANLAFAYHAAQHLRPAIPLYEQRRAAR